MYIPQTYKTALAMIFLWIITQITAPAFRLHRRASEQLLTEQDRLQRLLTIVED